MITADPDRTLSRYPGVKCFDCRKGRLAAVFKAVSWCDIAVVGGGELVQDQSSLLYSPYNLLPLALSAVMRKKAYAWGIGIGQGRELTAMTRSLVRTWLRTAEGVSARDRGSFNVLYRMGLREPSLLLASDSALSVKYPFKPGGALLGAAPRDVSNRTRHLLPLEIRKKLGTYRPADPGKAVARWAKLLDWYSARFDSDVVLFPFHTGTLSNDDAGFCRMIARKMKNAERVRIADPEDGSGFLHLMSECRILITTPLHGAILAFASGTVPVSVSYSSKCARFMEQAQLPDLVSSDEPGVPGRSTAILVERAWREWETISTGMASRLDELRNRSRQTASHFGKTFGL